METRILGRTGIAVTTLGYGAMELRHLNVAEAARMLNAVLDGGINFIDTSPDYGSSETYIGQAIAHRRDEFILASKCGCNVDENGRAKEPSHVWSRAKLLDNIENSLRLLRTDYLDVWQLHGTLPEWLSEGRGDETIATMMELKQQGKVRCIGISYRNGGPGDPLYPAGYSFNCMREFIEWDVFDVMQVVYGGLTRTSEIAIAKAADNGVGIIVRGVVKRYFDNYDDLFEQAGLDALLEEGESRNSFLLRFVHSHPGLGTMIIGTKNPDHLAANIAAATRGKLSDSVYAEAKHRLDAVGIVSDAV